MHLISFRSQKKLGIAASRDGKSYSGLLEGEPGYSGQIDEFIRRSPAQQSATLSGLLGGRPIDLGEVELLQPLQSPGKIICVGLNYRAHASESGFSPPAAPPLFVRFASSLIGPSDPLV